jgi:hypothetical protein
VPAGSRAGSVEAAAALGPLEGYEYGPVEDAARAALDAELDAYDPEHEIVSGFDLATIERDGALVGAVVVYALTPDNQAPGPFLDAASIDVERERLVGSTRVVGGTTADLGDAVAWYREPWGLVVVGTDPDRLDAYVDAWLAAHP